MINRIRNTRAFTLVELIVVIIILGVLATAAFAAFTPVINDSRVETVKSSLASLDNEAQAIRAFNPDKSADELTEAEGAKLTPVEELDSATADYSLEEDASDNVVGVNVDVAQIGEDDVTVELRFGDEVRSNGTIERVAAE